MKKRFYSPPRMETVEAQILNVTAAATSTSVAFTTTSVFIASTNVAATTTSVFVANSNVAVAYNNVAASEAKTSKTK